MLKLFRLLGPYRAHLTGIVGLAFAQSLANLYLPTLMADIVDVGIVRGDSSTILSVGGRMLAVAVLGTVCAVAGAYLAAKVSTGFGRIVRGRVFSRVSHLSLHQYARFATSSLITRTTNDTTQVQQVLTMFLNMVITAPMMALGGILLAVFQDGDIAWILIGVIPVVGLIFLAIMRAAVPLFQVMQTKVDRLNLIIDEGLTGVRVIRAFDRGAYERRRFDEANQDLTDTAVRVNRLVACLMPSLFLMMNLTSVAILWFGSHRIDAGVMGVGTMLASLQYAMQILFAVFMVTAMFVMLPRAAASAARINEVLDIEPDVTDPGSPAPAPTSRGVVEFDNVTFQYPGAEEPALTGQVHARRTAATLLRCQRWPRPHRRSGCPRPASAGPARAYRLRATESRALLWDHRHQHPVRARGRHRRADTPRSRHRPGPRVHRTTPCRL
jgi:ATP-binding cassette subfamily B protein